MEIFNIKKFSLHDGPGIRTTVFMRGCPLNCLWCHNPESFRQLNANQGCKSGNYSYFSTKELLKVVTSDILFYEESGGGVTFSGGEPMVQSKKLQECLRELRQMDIHTAIDTSGHAARDIFAATTELADLILFDLKLADTTLHKKYTGAGNEVILENFNSTKNKKKPVFVRIPLIPGITDTKRNLDVLKEIIRANHAVRRVDLLPYNELADSKYKRLNIIHEISGLKTQTENELQNILDIFSELPIEITLRG